MNKDKVRQQIIDVGIVPVLRVSSPSLAVAAAESVYQGGIPILEVTMTVPKATDVIRELVSSMPNDVIVGAGTVMDEQMVQQCLDAGAEFIVSPVFNAAAVELARRKGKLVMAGALTPTEVVQAWNHGSDFVKVFPCGNVGGPKYIRALKGPLPHIDLIPTGGVSLDTVQAYMDAGASALGVGSDLISEALITSGNSHQLVQAAQSFLAALRKARESARNVAAGNGKGV